MSLFVDVFPISRKGRINSSTGRSRESCLLFYFLLLQGYVYPQTHSGGEGLFDELLEQCERFFFPSSLLFFPHSIIENVSRVAGGLANNNDRQVLDVDDYPGN